MCPRWFVVSQRFCSWDQRWMQTTWQSRLPATLGRRVEATLSATVLQRSVSCEATGRGIALSYVRVRSWLTADRRRKQGCAWQGRSDTRAHYLQSAVMAKEAVRFRLGRNRGCLLFFPAMGQSSENPHYRVHHPLRYSSLPRD